MKVSFLVTYFNQEQYVKESIESILAIEKNFDWEILIGDDGSTDRTVSLVKDYINLYPDNIKLFIMPRDNDELYLSVKRASENRINLLENCSGDYFCILDGDDFYCDKLFVNEAIDVFFKNPDVSVVSFCFKFLRNGTFEKENKLSRNGNKYIDKEKYLNNLYVPAGACVHKKTWGKERVDYIKNVGFFDDNDIVINDLNYGKMYFINRSIYAYRQTDNSIYNSMNEIEQSVLNSLGFDIDKMLIDFRYHDLLVSRYKKSIILTYIYRNDLKLSLGNKYYIYIKSCDYIEDSLTYRLLSFPNLVKEKRILTRKQVIGIIIKYPLIFLRLYMKFLINNSKADKR